VKPSAHRQENGTPRRTFVAKKAHINISYKDFFYFVSHSYIQFNIPLYIPDKVRITSSVSVVFLVVLSVVTAYNTQK